MNKSFENGVQFAWDATSIKRAETCLRKYQYEALEGWQPNGASAHLIFGSHYATALEHYYKHRALGMSSNDALIEVVHEALIATWEHERDSAGERIPGTGEAWVSDHNLKTRGNLIRTIIWYVDTFENESIDVITLSDGKPAVEYSFSLPVDNGIVFAGHIDRLVTYADNPYVMDQKTTGGAISQHYMRGFSPDSQMSMYTFAGKAIYNLPVKGVIIDAAQIAVGFSRFERGFTMRTEGQLTEWYDNTMFVIEQAQTATRRNFFPMNPSACGNYGGCPFREICSLDPEFRERFLKANFTKGPTWDPLDRR